MERQNQSWAELRVSRITSSVPLNPLQHCLDPPSFRQLSLLTHHIHRYSNTTIIITIINIINIDYARSEGGGTKSQVIWSVCCFFKSLQPEPQQGERSCRFYCVHNPTWKYFTPRAQIQLDKWPKSENLKNLRPNTTATSNAMVPLSRLCQSYGPQQHIWLLLILHFFFAKKLCSGKVVCSASYQWNVVKG